MPKTILILGASFAGLQIAHKYDPHRFQFQLRQLTKKLRLLKHTLPSLMDSYKVVVVSPTDHHYWNLASVRGNFPQPPLQETSNSKRKAIIPGQIPDNEVSLPRHFTNPTSNLTDLSRSSPASPKVSPGMGIKPNSSSAQPLPSIPHPRP